MPRKPKPSKRPYIAVIGDMLDSRAFSSRQRALTQTRFAAFIQSLNQSQTYRPAIKSGFAITLGDEFQCILKNAEVLPDLIWAAANAPKLPTFRLGIGYGTIDTSVPRYAINLDGPALHRARQAIDTGKANGTPGGVFVGFGNGFDQAANGIARLLWFQLSKRTATQRTVMGLLRQGHSEIKIAKLLKRTPQAINAHKQASGWEAFQAGERALREVLRLATQAGGQ